jgi:hypothetical protein
MENKKELIKPELKNEINAKVVSLGEIEDNISEVKEYAIALSDYYKKLLMKRQKLTSLKQK